MELKSFDNNNNKQTSSWDDEIHLRSLFASYLLQKSTAAAVAAATDKWLFTIIPFYFNSLLIKLFFLVYLFRKMFIGGLSWQTSPGKFSTQYCKISKLFYSSWFCKQSVKYLLVQVFELSWAPFFARVKSINMSIDLNLLSATAKWK